MTGIHSEAGRGAEKTGYRSTRCCTDSACRKPVPISLPKGIHLFVLDTRLSAFFFLSAYT